MLAKGDKAPSFSLPDAEGKIYSLEDFTGSWLVLYFYPKDNTSGCTREAKEFSERKSEFEALGAKIIGISKDSPKSHARFIEKQGLSILLLSDEDHKVIEAYGAWGKKKMYGKEHWGTVRSTFLIDPEGIVRRAWYKVKVKGHVEEVLEALKDAVSEK